MARRRRKRPFREELKDLFAIHRSERRGFTVLLGLIALAAGWVVWEQWIRPPMLVDRETIRIVWAQLEEDTPRYSHRRSEPELFRFNPNELPIERWVQLGLSEQQARSIHKYEAKGGRFRTKSDLARMYVVDEALYELWEPYIDLPEHRPQRAYKRERPSPRDTTRREYKEHKPWKQRDAAKVPVELNTADTAALLAVRGIGPAFARGILSYRELLGGYVSLEQLGEVYILHDKPEALEDLRSKLLVDTSAIRRIPLNTCTVEELGRHPYMDWKVARILIAYRDQHGPFARVQDITHCVVVTDSLLRRMQPYLTVQE